MDTATATRLISKDVVKKAKQAYKKTLASRKPSKPLGQRDSTLFLRIMDEKRVARMEKAPEDKPPRPPPHWAPGDEPELVPEHLQNTKDVRVLREEQRRLGQGFDFLEPGP